MYQIRSGSLLGVRQVERHLPVSGYVVIFSILFCFLTVSQNVEAQSTTGGTVAVLPFVDHTHDLTLGNVLYQGFRNSLDLGQYLSILEEERMQGFLLGRSTADILKNPKSIEQFSIMTGVEYIIGGVVSESPDGLIQVSIMIFSGDEQAVLSTETRRYLNASVAVEDVADLCQYLSQAKHYVPRDSAFFYSLVLPGMGQFSLGYPDHAIVCLGVLSTALLYGFLNPQPDMYKYKKESFLEEWNKDEGQWHFYISGEEAPLNEYLQARSTAENRAADARDEQAAFKKRKNLSRWLVGSIWLLNLADTLFLSKRSEEGGAFFSLVGSIEQGQYPNSSYSLMLRFHLNLSRSHH